MEAQIWPPSGEYNVCRQHTHVMCTDRAQNDAGGMSLWIKPPAQWPSSAFLVSLRPSQNKHAVGLGPQGFWSPAVSYESLIFQPFPRRVPEGTVFKGR